MRMYSLSGVQVWLVVMSVVTKIVAASAGAAANSPTKALASAAMRAKLPLMVTRILLMSTVGWIGRPVFTQAA